MKVYHGSTALVKAPLVSAGRRNLDFGQGFYVTDLREQAIAWASRPINKGRDLWLNIYELDKRQAVSDGCSYLHFKGYDHQWLDFVVANRRGISTESYDIVEGGIANDRVFNTIELYMADLISQDEALRRLRYEKPNNQVCILSQTVADRYLTFIGAEPIIQQADNE